MSDPKDKLVLFKEILSLMIVTIGFITALMSSGVVKNIKIEPVTLIIIIAVVLFIVQLLVRMVFGEDHYVEVKKKVLATARDFSIVLLIIIGFYFAGKYAANYNPAVQPPSQTSFRVADASKEIEKGLSAAPLKNLKKEKTPQPKPKDKDKDKAAAKKSDVKHSKDDEKPSKNDQKASAKHDNDQNLKTAANEDKKDDKSAKASVAKEPVTDKTEEKKEAQAAANSQMAEKKTEPVELTSSPAPAEVLKQPEKEVKTTETATTAQAALPAAYKTSEVSAVKEAKPVQTPEMAAVKEVKPEQTAETLLAKEPSAVPHLNVPAAATSEILIAAETKKTEPAKPAEPVVIDVIAEDIVSAPAASPVKNEAAPTAAVDASETVSASTASKDSDEVLSYKLTKDPDEENDEDISAAGTTVKFEQTSDELREKVNNDKVVIKKEYEINKTPYGLKNAGEKVMEGGRKIFDGGANLLEKAGHGIKKQINKVIK
ncbi:MAG: hypothetical protein A2008_13060 [Candidatus Wallbacteria bacterium GWC2_49_35]|uniref:Uncharacterized protein n=1 Tax=Candidatus Wallbacteria bacterium GWC2_49_35 TaxID=1817813 RepID=A0A1F7WLD9_9BACT|nr:MAG: hypothetical protein A2008_13060 [Candidatus Wallbacteria bacterium GWC2_49_35]HBC74396.1 hypothetical protein [Candidatus Wallbacteria bacterium]